MGANPFITHRMFVAALTQDAIGTEAETAGRDHNETGEARAPFRGDGRTSVVSEGILLVDAMVQRLNASPT